MSKAGPLKLATLHGAVGERVSLGWTPRDVRQRVAKSGWEGSGNWLKVHGDVHCPEGAWTFRDSAITEGEACELIEFLAMRPWTRGRSIRFLEPCLAFSTRGESDGLVNIDIRFRAEVSPPWIWDDPDQVWHEGFTLGLYVKVEELRRFTNDLRGMLGLPT